MFIVKLFVLCLIVVSEVRGDGYSQPCNDIWIVGNTEYHKMIFSSGELKFREYNGPATGYSNKSQPASYYNGEDEVLFSNGQYIDRVKVVDDDKTSNTTQPVLIFSGGNTAYSVVINKLNNVNQKKLYRYLVTYNRDDEEFNVNETPVELAYMYPADEITNGLVAARLLPQYDMILFTSNNPGTGPAINVGLVSTSIFQVVYRYYTTPLLDFDEYDLILSYNEASRLLVRGTNKSYYLYFCNAFGQLVFLQEMLFGDPDINPYPNFGSVAFSPTGRFLYTTVFSQPPKLRISRFDTLTRINQGVKDFGEEFPYGELSAAPNGWIYVSAYENRTSTICAIVNPDILSYNELELFCENKENIDEDEDDEETGNEDDEDGDSNDSFKNPVRFNNPPFCANIEVTPSRTRPPSESMSTSYSFSSSRSATSSRSTSNTPSQSGTGSNTSSRSPSSSPTRSDTSSVTPSISNTRTSSITPSNTRSSSASSSSSQSRSSSISQSRSASSSQSSTISVTSSKTSRRSNSATRSSTASKTSSQSMSNSNSESLSSSSSASRSTTPTATKTVTRTPSNTRSTSLSASKTRTSKRSFSTSKSSTESRSMSASMSWSPSSSKSQSRPESPTKSTSNTRSATPSASVSISESGTGSTSKSSSISMSNTQSITSSKSLSASPSDTRTPKRSTTPSKSKSGLPSNSNSVSSTLTPTKSASSSKTLVDPSNTATITNSRSGSRSFSASRSSARSETASRSSKRSVSPSKTPSRTSTVLPTVDVEATQTPISDNNASSSLSAALFLSLSPTVLTVPSFSSTISKSASASGSASPLQSIAIVSASATVSTSAFTPSFSASISALPVVGPSQFAQTRSFTGAIAETFPTTTSTPSLPSTRSVNPQGQIAVTNDDGKIVAVVGDIQYGVLDVRLARNLPPIDQSSGQVASAVVEVNLFDRDGNPLALTGSTSICLQHNTTKKDDACLGYLDETVSPAVWRCEDPCLQDNSEDGFYCGSTTHFTNFAILLSGGSGSKCDNDSDVYIFDAGWKDAILIGVTAACIVCCLLIIALILYTPFGQHFVLSDEARRIKSLRQGKEASQRQSVNSLAALGDEFYDE